MDIDQIATLTLAAKTSDYTAGMNAKVGADERALASGEKLADGLGRTGAAVEQTSRRLKDSINWWARAVGPIDEVARATYDYQRKVKQLDDAMSQGLVGKEALSRAEITLKRDLDAGRLSLEAYERQLRSVREAHASGALEAQEYARAKQQIDARYTDRTTQIERQLLQQQEQRLTQARAELALIGQTPEVRAREKAILEQRLDLQSRGISLESANAKLIMENAHALADLNAALEQATAAKRAQIQAEEAARKLEQEAARAAEAQRKATADLLESQRQKNALLQTELQYAGAERTAAERALEMLRAQFDLKARGIALDSQEGQIILQNLAHQQRMKEQIQQAADAKRAQKKADEDAVRAAAETAALEARLLQQQEHQLALLRTEAALAGKLPEERAKALAMLKAEQDLATKGISATSASGAKFLANAQEIEALRQKNKALAGSLTEVGGAAALTRNQMLTLQYTANDVVASLASGMSPLTILLQQGGQVTQAWGGVGATFRAAAAALGPFGLAAAALGGAFVGAVAASESWRGELRAMGLAARAGGDALGYTRDQLIDLGAATAAAAGTSDAAGRQIVAGLARARLGGDALAAVAAQARDFAALTGQEIPQAADALGKLFADPAKGARDLDAAYGLLTAAQLRQIQTLADQGRKTEAQLALSDALGQRIRGLADEDLGYIAKAWKAVSEAASNAWDAMGRGLSNWGKNSTLDDQIANARARLAFSTDGARSVAAENNPIFKGNNYPEDRRQADSATADAAALERQRAQMDLVTLLRIKDRQEVEQQEKASAALRQEELKWLNETADGLDATTAQRRALADQMARVYALAQSLETTDPAAAEKARATYERMESRLEGMISPTQEAARAAQRAQALAGLTGAQRALKQAEFETQDAIARGVEYSDRAALAEANRAKALAGLADASAQTMRGLALETAALLAQADALGISSAAAHQAQAAAQARAAAVGGQVTNEAAYRQALLDRAAAENLLASVQKTRDLRSQADSAQRLAAAEKQGAVAVRDVTLALADEADARETLAKATDGTLARLLEELEVRKRLRRETADAEVSRRATQTLAGQSGDLESLRLELSLVGKLPALRAQELEILRVKQQLLRDGIDLNSEEGRKILENARLMGELRGQLEEQNRAAEAQQKIWDNAIEGIQGNFASFFEGVLSGGTNTWRDLAGGLKSVMMKTIAEIATAMVFRPVIGGALGAVGLGNVAQAAGLSSGSGASSGGSGLGLGSLFGGSGTSGSISNWLFGSAGTGNINNPASYVPGTSGVFGSGGNVFGIDGFSPGTAFAGIGTALSAFNFAKNPSVGSGLGLVGSGLGLASSLGMIAPAFGPIGMIASVAAPLLGSLFGGNKVKHPGMGIELMLGQQGLELGKVSGKHMDTSGATPMGQAAIDAINGVVKSMTGGSVGAGTGGQVYGISYDASGGKQRYRAVGEGLSESTEYKTAEEAISAVTVSALKNLPLQGVAENVATALKKSTADSLEGIKSDLDFAKGFADSMALLKSGLDPMKSQAAEIAKAAKDAATGLQAWGTQFRDKAVGLGQATAEEVNAALRSMADGALGLTKAAEPLSGYALAWEQAKANISALKDVLVDFGFTAAETAAKLAAATETARQKLVSDQNSGLSSEILKLKDPKAADLADLEKWKAAAIAEAKAIGNQQGIALIEELFGLKQQAIVEQYAQRIEGLTAAQQKAVQVLTDLTSRALAVRQLDRQKALFDFDQQAAAQLAAAPAGTEGALSRVLTGERAKLEFEGYQRDLLEAIDRQIRGVQDQKSAVEAQISAIKAETQALDGLRDSLLKFQQDLKLDAGLSILSTGQRRTEAMARMDGLYAKGMAGDMDALREWEPLARQFLAISRDYNASTPGYVSDYTKVQGQLDGALGKIKTPLQVAEAQLATLEAQSKQFDQQISLLQQQRDTVQRTGERTLDGIGSLTAGMMEALGRWTAAQADLATGFGSLAAAISGQKAAAAANSNVKLGSDGRPVGLLGGGLDVVGQDNTAYSEWSQEKKDAWRTLATNLGINEDLYFKTGGDFVNALRNADGSMGDLSATDGIGTKYVGASGQIYNTYAEHKAATDLASNQLGQWLTQQGTTFDEALRQAAKTGVIIGGGDGRQYQAGGIVGAYAAGGVVGNGLFDRDSVVARYAGGGNIALAGGEFVVTATAVNGNTLPLLEAINTGKRLPSVPVPPVYRPAPAAVGMDSAAIVAAIGQLGEKIDALAEVVAVSGDQSAEALAGVRTAMGALALAAKQQKLVA